MTHPSESIETLRQAAAAASEADVARIAVQLLNQGAVDSEPRRQTVEVLEQFCAGRASSLCECLLGMYFLHNYRQAGAVVEALRWLNQAAGRGAPVAIERLADLYAGGQLVAQSLDTSFQLLERLANAGFQKSAWHLGYLHSLRGRESHAVGAFARACALGSPPAFYSLGLRFAQARGVARDPSFAAALLMRAADARYPQALETARQLVPEQFQNPQARNWYQALARNFDSRDPRVLAHLQQGVAAVDDVDINHVKALERHFAALGHTGLVINDAGRLAAAPAAGGDGGAYARRPSEYPAPQAWKTLCQRPRISTCAGFASTEECAYVVHAAAQSMKKPPTESITTSNNLLETSLFDGSMHIFEPSASDLVVSLLKKRMADHCGVKPEVIEPLSAISYGPGHEYRAHVDYFDPEELKENARHGRELGGQRIATFLICIQPPQKGGETAYDRVGVTVSHQLGMAALHYNVDDAGQPAENSEHRSTAVESGQKWLLRTAVREAPF
ncbi:MAG: 2OG-Fe(II) oxygenase [Wenzhouxiangellaceae bacterium]|nr:2OG-Fe(II) oxygenase [Wenzhouxiangellaceae bacterium]